MSQDYPVLIYWSDEDQIFIADIPDLQVCKAHGDTPEEALREVLVAKEGWLAAARANGYRIPKPSRQLTISRTA